MNPSWPVFWHDVLDSTNEEARRQAADGNLTPVWIAARQQTAGRGRLGRTWVSPSGNLFTTALFREPGGVAVATRVPFVAGLAVHDALNALAGCAVLRLKWPNDVRVDGAKICGILIESGQQDGAVWIAAGIGINVTTAPEATGQATTSLADLRQDNAVTAEHVLDALRECFAFRLEQARGDFALTRAAWLERAEGLGGPVRVRAREAVIEGVFETLASDGGLVLRRADGQMHTVTAGDVELVREV